MNLANYLEAVAKTPFELIYARNDRRNYLLTTRHWAENLDRHRDEIVARWGERWYRRFRLYLWGCVHCFSSDDVTAYRLLLELPADSGARRNVDGDRFSRSGKPLAARVWTAARRTWRFPRASRP
jgi:cyclopropane-fatty-acyl-phospholipid synthase